MAVVTVLGASGLIGSHLGAHLRRLGHEVLTPGRDARLVGRDHGVVYYCIGVTADFRRRPFDTVTAHVTRLAEDLRHGQFRRLVYLSSTRVYGGSGSGVEEQLVQVDSSDADHLYNLTKLAGESLALHSGRDTRVVRLANVFGDDWHSDNFLPSLIKAALREGTVRLRTSPDSAKDYVSLPDVLTALACVGFGGRHRVYNVASGRNVATAAILAQLRRLTGCDVVVDGDAPAFSYPPIDIQRLRADFGFTPACLLDRLEQLVDSYRQHRESWDK